jgi:hypothetical protein
MLLLAAWGIPTMVPAAPASPVLVSPASNAVNVGTSPTLQVNVSDSSGGSLTVRFYGRTASPGPDFTIAVLPDSQYYCATMNGGVPAMFYAQTDWIVANRLARNIAYVAHLGDIVNYGDNNAGTSSHLTHWRNATNALYRLENPATTGLPNGIPYGAAVGNHDQSPNGDPNGTTTFYNQFFGTSHFAGRAYYGAAYGANNDNHFDLFSAGGMDFIAVYLEYDENANPALLAWANTILQTYPHRRAILVSHYLGTPATPSAFSAQGAAIYNALKGNPNLFLLLAGHRAGEGSRSDIYNGSTIHTLVSDYQSRTDGGSGWLRLMEFSPSNSVIRVSTYTPWLDQYETDADSQFTLPYPMQPAATAFAPIGTNSNVPSGFTTSCVWPGLSPGTTYEWYATVSNGSQTTTGPVWRFTTTLTNSYNTAPTLGAFPHQTILANTSTTNIPFTIGDLETAPTHLNVSVYSAHATLLPQSGVTLGGAGANRTLRLTPAADEAGASWITVVVSDGALSASSSFMLKVLRPQIITLWDFNSNPPDTNTSTGTLVPALGAGACASVGTATNSLNSNVSPVSFDPNPDDNSKWRLAQFPLQGTSNRTSGAEFRVSTAGCRNIALSWDHYNSATGSRYWRLQYSLDGLNFTDYTLYTNPVEVTWFPTGAGFAGIPGANDNPSFGVRLVSEWESTATGRGADQYIGTRADGGYTTAGTLWLDMVTLSGDVIQPALAIRQVGNFLQLSWPTNRWLFTLQSRTNLSAGSWDSFGQPPVVTNGNNLVITTNAPEPRFFRLAH